MFSRYLFRYVVVPRFTFNLFNEEKWSRGLADVSGRLHDASIDTALSGTPMTSSGATCDELQYPSPYSVEDHIRLHFPKRGASQSR